MPVISYKAWSTHAKAIVPRSFSLVSDQTDECPVSMITGKSGELVKKYHQARGQGKTLGQLLKSNEAWIEDVEETLDQVRLEVKYEMEKDRQRQKF